MRSGGVVCSIQQSLTAEAGNTVKQAISLARRRGHAQVTPIHVATVMLVSPLGLLKTACLKSHSHPLQIKALELCFNVALNRLPTTTPYNSITNCHSHQYYPSLSNALVAAFKRAQAHQRRGSSTDNQQQSILAVKIEIEQLVISILDDPSVSRVMREAGFSSTQIKSNVELAVSIVVTSHPPPPLLSSCPSMINNSITTPFEGSSAAVSFKPSSTVNVTNEDVTTVFESLVSQSKKKKNTIIVGESLANCEGVVRAMKERIERGGTDVPLELSHVQFMTLPIFSVKGMSREEIDLKLGEIRCLLKRSSFVGGGKGIILYLGDLKWLSEYWGYYKNHGEQGSRNYNYYCPLEHMIMGLRRLIFGCNYGGDGGRLWLMGIATFSSYIKCKSGHNPSLETLLDLYPLTIPVGGLELRLNLLDRSSHEGGDTKSNIISDVEKENCHWGFNIDSKFDMQLTCCTDCSSNFHREAQNLSNSSTPTTSTNSSSLPSWLQKCIKEETKDDINDQDENVSIKELCKKWNSFCSSTHNNTTNYIGRLGKVINFSASPSPSSPTSISSYDQKTDNPTWPLHIAFGPSKWPTINKDQVFPLMTEQKPDLLSNPSSTPNSASSSEATEPIMVDKLPSRRSNDHSSFKEHNNTDDLKAMCLALEKRVPWQKDIIPDIVSTVLKCRAGLMVNNGARRRGAKKQETWMSFLGVDDEGKVEIARELANLVFGSQSNFKWICLMSSNFAASTRADSTDHEFSNKRRRDHEAAYGGYLERLGEAIRDNPHQVFYVEDVEQIDMLTQKGIKRAIETGEIILSDGDVVNLKDAIVIFGCDGFSSNSRACSPPSRQKVEKNDEEGVCLPLDLNLVDDHEDGSAGEHSSFEDVQILEAVDRQIFFKIQVL